MHLLFFLNLNYFWNSNRSPSKSTCPSPLRSTSRRISSISRWLSCSPISFFMASLSSPRLIWPSPSESNWGKQINKVHHFNLQICVKFWYAYAKQTNKTCLWDYSDLRLSRFCEEMCWNFLLVWLEVHRCTFYTINCTTDLFEGIPELLDANHICSLSEHFRTHELDKVFKVHSAPTLRGREKECSEDKILFYVTCSENMEWWMGNYVFPHYKSTAAEVTEPNWYPCLRDSST